MSSEDVAMQASSRSWQCQVAEIVTEDLTGPFPWARRHALIAVMQPGQHSMVVAVDGDDRTVPFPSQTAPLHNLAALNGLLQREEVRLPESLKPEESLQPCPTGRSSFLTISLSQAEIRNELQVAR